MITTTYFIICLFPTSKKNYYNDVGVVIVGFLLLNDELSHSSTTSLLCERKLKEV
jgi:hypothetical protein